MQIAEESILKYDKNVFFSTDNINLTNDNIILKQNNETEKPKLKILTSWNLLYKINMQA